jgi:signal peptidase II
MASPRSGRSPSSVRPARRALPWQWLGIALAVVLADQFTKTLVVGWFQPGESRTVTAFFNLVRVHNPGAAFSFLAGASGWQRWFFAALGAAAAVFIVRLLARHGGERLFAWALALILGGAVGNVIDRLLHGHVIDFIQVHYARAWYFPAFNVADSAISIGAVLLVVDELRRVRRG